MKMAKTEFFWGTGRRKKAVARVRLVAGKGAITVNKRDLDEYFGLETLKTIVRQPLTLTDTLGKYDVFVNVNGGGFTGQAGAIRHGVARALNAADAETVMDVTGLIVSPGLIDMHCHVYPVFPYQMPDSLRTINAEEYMFRAGVTTAVDAGTTGWRNFGDFKENVIDATKVRVLAFIDMAAKGMHYPPSEQAVADINPEITAAVANTWSDVIVGVKSAHYWAKHEDADHPIWASIDGAIKARS